jgi:hypothetical protein
MRSRRNGFNKSQAFEVLKNLALPDFSLDQWQSTIRGRVNVHGNYGDLRNWIGGETADIVYHDQHSSLTEKLISQGYLDGTVWINRTPTYYIEVKSTLGAMETQFYCSHSQVNRMNGMRLSASNPGSNDIYLIIRVFSLGSMIGTGFKIYFDPDTLRERGELVFKSDKYIVTVPYQFRFGSSSEQNA